MSIYEPPHPGKVIQELLNRNKLSQMAFAEIIRISRTYLNQIITGVKDVNIGTAHRLARATGTKPGFWLDLQQTYDMHKFRATPEYLEIQKLPCVIQRDD